MTLSDYHTFTHTRSFRVLVVALMLPVASTMLVACATANRSPDQRLIDGLRPFAQPLESYGTPVWYPDPLPIDRVPEPMALIASGRSREVDTVAEGVQLAREGARARLQAVLDDVHSRAQHGLQADVPRSARTVVVGTPDDTAAAMELVGWSTIDGPVTGAASLDSRNDRDRRASRLPLPEPEVTRWAIRAPGVNNQRRVFCQLRLARTAIDTVVSQALRQEWRRVHGSPPDAMDVVRIRQAIADAWRDRRQPE